MRAPQIILSDAAQADILEQFEWYETKAGEKLARRWNEAATTTVLRIANRPGIGSPCHFRPEELRDTRRVAVKKFPKHLIFYQTHGDGILVLRIVHGARDLESLFSRPEE